MNTELISYLATSEAASGMVKVLVVDDESSVLEMISRYLLREGYQVDTASNGRVALEKVQRNRPDVVILDIKMPVMDGMTLCQVLRKDFRTRGLPIILLTAKLDFADRLHGFQSGADDYILKPFDLQELKVRVEGTLQRRRWDQWSHPLTKLPGNPGIEEEVRRRLKLGVPFAFAYIDIDDFKAYNDSYGYESGDRILKEVADTLLEASVSSNLRQGFPGHIGGDDFVVVAPVDAMKIILPEVVEAFDTARLAYYRPEDRERGTIKCRNRRGEDQVFPLVSLSIAVVSTETRTITHYARLAEIASELKHYIKSLDHHNASLIMWDRRTDEGSSKEKPHG